MYCESYESLLSILVKHGALIVISSGRWISKKQVKWTQSTLHAPTRLQDEERVVHYVQATGSDVKKTTPVSSSIPRMRSIHRYLKDPTLPNPRAGLAQLVVYGVRSRMTKETWREVPGGNTTDVPKSNAWVQLLHLQLLV